MIQLSVIMYNLGTRQDYLRRALQALRDQTLSKSQWELLLVHHAGSAEFSEDIKWHPNERHIFEDGKEVVNTLMHGVRHANSSILVFTESNQILDPNYLSEALRISQQWPWLGLWGSGASDIEYEVEPPEHLKAFSSIIGLRHARSPQWSNVLTCVETSPGPAGLCVRKDLVPDSSQPLPSGLRRYRNFSREIEKVEIAYRAYSQGLGMGVFPELKQVLLFPKEHATNEYFLASCEYHTFFRHLLNRKWKAPMQIDPLSSVGLLTSLRDVLLRRGFARRISIADLRGTWNARRTILTNRSPL